jgi:hypothetical protein
MNIDRFLSVLPVLGTGILGIFIIIGIMTLVVVVLTKIFPSKPPKKEE